MIPYIQPIFVPDEHRFLQNKESIKSFANYLKVFNYDIKCVFGGWAFNDELWNKIRKVISDNIPKDKLVCIIRFDKNYGKAYIVNNLYLRIKKLDFNYFLTADSDIIFPLNTKNIFERLEDIAESSALHIKKKFGYISLNQEMMCAHILQKMKNTYTITNRFGNKEIIKYPSKPSGIAGGCLFIGRENWEKIGGYKVMGVYAGEDAYLLIDTHKKEYSYQIAMDISIIHPFVKDIEYQKWKTKILHNGSTDGRNRTIDELNNIIKLYDKYWNRRNN